MLAETELQVLCPSLLTGAAVYAVVTQVATSCRRHHERSVDLDDYDEQTKARLVSESTLYRWFRPLVDWIHTTRLCRVAAGDRLRLSVGRGATKLPPQMFVALCMGHSLVVGVVVGCLALTRFGPRAVFVSLLAALGMYWLQLRKLHEKAEQNAAEFEAGIPFAIDLAGLMLNSGCDLHTAISIVADESGVDCIEDQFGQLRRDLRDGETLGDSLQSLERRLDIAATTEVTTAIRKADELGTPLARAFLDLADQMRVKRAQAVEALSGQAQVKIAGPTLLIMIACMISICAPFLFGLLSAGSLL